MSILQKVEEMKSENNTNNNDLKSSPIVVALDYADKNAALAFADRIDPQDCRLKVGKEMFTLFEAAIGARSAWARLRRIS